MKVSSEILLTNKTNDLTNVALFDKDIFGYNFKLNNSYLGMSISFSDILLTSNKSIHVLPGSSELKLKIGMNIISIEVTAENGNIQLYTFNIELANDNTNINDVIINDKKTGINFKTDSIYELILDNKVSKEITLNVITSDNLATVTINGFDNESLFTLTDGKNIFNINVLAADGVTMKEYTLILIKKSRDSSLEIIIDDILYEFNELNELLLDDILFDKLNYKIETIVHDSAKVTITGKGYNNKLWTVSPGLNELIIIVTAEDETYQTYTIKVNKEEPNINLEDLSITSNTNDNLPFEVYFKDGLFKYDLILDEASTLTEVKLVVKMNDFQSISITEFLIKLNVVNGKIDQTIKFNLLYRDIEVSEYSIRISKGIEKSKNNNLDGLFITHLDGTDAGVESVDNTFSLTNVLGFNISELNLLINTHQAATITDVTGGHLLINNQIIKLKLTTGETKITFTITSESGLESEVYTIVIEREEPSKEAFLSDLELTLGGEVIISSTETGSKILEFDSNTFVYDFTSDLYKFDRSYLNKTLHWNTDAPDGVIVTPGKNIVVDRTSHTFKFLVTAQSGATNTYEIKIKIENSDVLVDTILADGDEVTIDSNNIIKLDQITDKTNTYVIDVNVNNHLKYSEYKTEYYVNDKATTGNELIDYLEYRENNIKVVVIPEDGNITNTKTYNFTLLREDTRSKDNKLDSLILMDLTNNNELTLSSTDEFNYNIELLFSINRLSLTININELATLVDVTGLSIVGNKTLNFDFNESLIIKFSIKAENEDVSPVYTIKLNKLEASTNKDLLDLEVSLKDSLLVSSSKESLLRFETGKKIYKFDTKELKFDQSYTGLLLDFSTVLVSEYATYEVINKKLIKGSNEIVIRITAEDQSTDDIKIIILLENSNYEVDTIIVNKDINVDLNKALLDGFTLPEVDTNNTNLSIVVTIKDLLQYNDAKITITGNESLKVGTNNIYINIEAEDGSNKKEFLLIQVVNEVPSDDASLANIVLGTKNYDDSHFTNNILEVELEYELNYEISLLVDPTDGRATVTIDRINNDGLLDLTYGNNIITFTILAEDKVTSNTFTIKILTKSINNGITNIEIPNYDLDKNFNQDELIYNLSVDGIVSNIDIDVVAESYAIINGMGNYSLSYGNNEFKVFATNEFGEEGNVYIINVYRKSDDATIDEILVDGENIEFDHNSKEVIIKYPYTDGAKIELEFKGTEEKEITGSGIFDLSHGNSNEYIVTVISEDGTINEYKVIVDALYDDYTITNIEVDNFDLDFKEDIFSYTLDLDYTVNKLNLAVTKNEFATTTIIKDTKNRSSNNLDLNVGVNKFSIFVTSEYGTEGNKYNLTVNKTSAPLSSDASVVHIEVVGYHLTPNFDDNIKEYTLNVSSNVNKLDIVVTKGHEGQTVVISEAANNLIAGINRIIITVTSEDGTVTNTFTITVNKDTNKVGIVVLIVTLSSLAIIGISAFIILFVVKSKKGKFTSDIEVSFKEKDNKDK